MRARSCTRGRGLGRMVRMLVDVRPRRAEQGLHRPRAGKRGRRVRGGEHASLRDGCLRVRRLVSASMYRAGGPTQVTGARARDPMAPRRERVKGNCTMVPIALAWMEATLREPAK